MRSVIRFEEPWQKRSMLLGMDAAKIGADLIRALRSRD